MEARRESIRKSVEESLKKKRWSAKGGAIGWMKRLIKFGLGLVMMQPLAVALFVNVSQRSRCLSEDRPTFSFVLSLCYEILISASKCRKDSDLIRIRLRLRIRILWSVNYAHEIFFMGVCFL